jgi:hypothetical protein
MFSILGSRMENFILGSEWDLIFFLCFVAQAIQSLFEI